MARFWSISWSLSVPKFGLRADPIRWLFLLLGLFLGMPASWAIPLGTRVAYTGELQVDGLPAEGNYDFRFELFDAATAGNPVGPTLEFSAIPVTSGTFEVRLDFGSGVFGSEARWLQVSVRTNTTPALDFRAIGPRVEMLPVPTALFATRSGVASRADSAGTATSADSASRALLADRALTADVATTAGSATSATSATTAQHAVRADTAALADRALVADLATTATTAQRALNADIATRAESADFADIAMDADKLNGFDSSHFALFDHFHSADAIVTGILSDERLSPNVALLSTNQTFLGTNRFSGPVIFEHPSNVITGTLTLTGPLQSAGGQARGEGAIDLQVLRWSDEQVASGERSTISGGRGNLASGASSTVGGGEINRGKGVLSTISGGFDNEVSGTLGTISGGQFGVVSGVLGAIGGGYDNEVWETLGTISGGQSNRVSGVLGTVGGGQLNRVTGILGTISGGEANGVTGVLGFVGGGIGNLAVGDRSVVGGGTENKAAEWGSVIAGGKYNLAAGVLSVVSGGESNRAANLFSVVGGGKENLAQGVLSVVSGGETNAAGGVLSTVAGGVSNFAGGDRSVVSGGTENQAVEWGSIVAGGKRNLTSGVLAAISGGESNKATSLFATVAGGSENVASGDSSSIPGGRRNEAAGFASLAAGHRAKAGHDGSFVWADAQDTDFASTAANQFIVRADKVGLGTNAPQAKLHVAGDFIRVDGLGNEQGYIGGDGIGGDVHVGSFNPAVQKILAWNYPGARFMDIRAMSFTAQGNNGERAYLTGSSGYVLLGSEVPNVQTVTLWNSPNARRMDIHINDLHGRNLDVNALYGSVYSPSDRALKQDFEPIQPKDILAKVLATPIQFWSYTNSPSIRHIGPTAQDFKASFDLGEDDRHIAAIDADGVAMAAIQGLHALVTEKDTAIRELRKELQELREAIQDLQKAQAGGRP